MAERQQDRLSGCLRQVHDLHSRWLSFLARNLISYQLVERSARDPGFQIEARARSQDGFTVARVVTSEGKSSLEGAPRALGAGGDGRFILYTSLRGRIEFTTRKHNQICDPSVSVMIDTSEPFFHAKMGDNDTLCFVMPRRFVEQRIANPQAACMLPLTPASSALCRLFHDTLTGLERDATLMTDSDFECTCRLVGDLLLLAMRGLSPLPEARSVRQATLARVKRVIEARLSDPDLTLSEIAGRCNISLGYLHSLFKDDGRTAWAFLTGERLSRARLLLERPSQETTVTEVGLSCGYANLSQFSTAFRHAFGLSPRDLLHRGIRQ